MPISRQTYAANTWHEITAGTTTTQITHNSGQGTVVYTESDTEPSSPYDGTEPINNISTSHSSDNNVYYVNVIGSIWIYPISYDADLTVTAN